MRPDVERRVDARHLLDRALRPHAPVAEQAAADAQRHRLVAAPHHKGRQQVQHDVVVVAGVQRDTLFGTGHGHAADHVERAVAVEGRHLDGDDVVDGREALPELRRQHDAADRRLQVEADQRDALGHGRAMRHQLIDRRALHRRQRQHAGVVAQATRDVGLGHRLCGAGRTSRRSSPWAPASIRPRCARPSPAPVRTGRRRGSRTAWNARPPPARRRRHPGSSVSAHAGAPGPGDAMRPAPADGRG